MRFLTLIMLVVIVACNSPRNSLFSKSTPHEKYVSGIKAAGLEQKALGKNWLNAANLSQNNPVDVTMPFRERGYFDSTAPRAIGFRFKARRGEVIMVELSKKPANGFTIFLELWYNGQEMTTGSTNKSLITSIDTLFIKHEVEKEGYYNVFAQPELLSGGEYTITISTGPSLAFPVPSENKPRIGSFWGDARDAGARSHEGIDIFGSLRTPVVAAATGRVNSVITNNLGGKVIFMRPENKPFTLYYAHLDSQIAVIGQQVKQGEIIGLMGKTGNAKNTPVHLHFGIYAQGGAIDPLPFIEKDRKVPAEITAVKLTLNKPALIKKQMVLRKSPASNAPAMDALLVNTFVRVTGATGSWYKIELPGGIVGYGSDESLGALKTIRTITIATEQALLDQPVETAAAKKILQPRSQVQQMASYKDFFYVQMDDTAGWIQKTSD